MTAQCPGPQRKRPRQHKQKTPVEQKLNRPRSPTRNPDPAPKTPWMNAGPDMDTNIANTDISDISSFSYLLFRKYIYSCPIIAEAAVQGYS